MRIPSTPHSAPQAKAASPAPKPVEKEALSIVYADAFEPISNTVHALSAAGSATAGVMLTAYEPTLAVFAGTYGAIVGYCAASVGTQAVAAAIDGLRKLLSSSPDKG